MTSAIESTGSYLSVFGAGGHAKVVIDALLSRGGPQLVLYDDDPEKLGSEVLGVEVRGGIQAFAQAAGLPGIIAVGDNRTRRNIAESFPERSWSTAVHLAAYVHRGVCLGPGSVVLAGAVIQPEATVGPHVIVNTGALVDHDCTVDAFCHIGPGAVLAGQVRLGEGVLVGANATILPRVTVGEWATIGAGSVVVHDLPPGVVVRGNPARSQDGCNAGARDE